MTLSELDKRVANLPPYQFDQFRRWFHEFENRKWDREIERDVEAGRLDALADEALAAHQTKLTKPPSLDARLVVPALRRLLI